MGCEVCEWVKRPTQDLLTESDTVSLPGSESTAKVSEAGSDDGSDEEPLIRAAIPSRKDDVNTVPASSSAVAACLGPLVTTEADEGQVDEHDADMESLSNHSAVEVEPQVRANTSNRVRRRHLQLHWRNAQVSQVTH